MEITPAQIAAGLTRAQQRLATLEQELNQADAELGDGDTGSMLARVLGAMSASGVAAAPDASAAFALMGKATMGATGSSLGTLFATALMSLSRQYKDRPATWRDLGPMLVVVRDGMIARGGAALGDKTVIDALDAVAQSLDGADSAKDASYAAILAAEQALVAFRDQPCRMGRAKFFADKSIGRDDPGMLAFVELTKALKG